MQRGVPSVNRLLQRRVQPMKRGIDRAYTYIYVYIACVLQLTGRNTFFSFFFFFFVLFSVFSFGDNGSAIIGRRDARSINRVQAVDRRVNRDNARI